MVKRYFSDFYILHKEYGRIYGIREEEKVVSNNLIKNGLVLTEILGSLISYPKPGMVDVNIWKCWAVFSAGDSHVGNLEN